MENIRTAHVRSYRYPCLVCAFVDLLGGPRRRRWTRLVVEILLRTHHGGGPGSSEGSSDCPTVQAPLVSTSARLCRRRFRHTFLWKSANPACEFQRPSEQPEPHLRSFSSTG
eukprot:9485461-Pyramimonas_sp.AAC.1